ncbi:peptidoglycan-binding protein [Streptomyces sp. NPDC001530]|uniref:peptidoglycan-binding domain-containing protein n=1 Tax=Streptomyces sp. NPDC001530 TaxID=3364582 RepID=UPI00368FA2B6
MTEQNSHICPECAAPRAPDGTPSCACTQRASDALRDARTAEAAAAEDFDPLRIRPYVELGTEGSAEGSVGDGASGGADNGGAPTMRLAAVPSEPQPYVADVRLFHEQPPPTASAEAGPPAVSDERPRRRRRTAVLGVAGGVVAVVAAAGIASGLFSYDAPARDGALPEDVRASVPDVSSEAATVTPSENAPSTAPTSAPAVPAPSRSASPSPSASRSSESATPSRSATPTQPQTQTPTTATATGSIEPTRNGSDNRRAQTLRRGDKGPEVTELQLRLRQLSVYTGDDNGKYDDQLEQAVRRYQWARGITADEQGVYGSATRTSLESETAEP